MQYATCCVEVWVDQLGCAGQARAADSWLADSLSLLNPSSIHFDWWTWKGVSDTALLRPSNCSHQWGCGLDLATYQPDWDLVARVRQAFQ